MPDYKKYFKIPAPPEEVYMALTNEFTIELWTGEKAMMKAEAGTEFSMWDGAITGRVIELVPNKKIVQEWFFDEDSQSILTIKLHEVGSSTSVEVRHTNIPGEAWENMVEGWEGVYMGSLQDYFEDDE